MYKRSRYVQSPSEFCSPGDKDSLGHGQSLVLPMAMSMAVLVMIMAICMVVTMTLVVSMLCLSSRILERNRFRKFLVAKVGKPSVLEHLLNLIFHKSMVCDATVGSILGVYLVSDKINDKEYTTSLETFSQSLRRQFRLVKMVESESHAGNIKIKELGIRKGRRRGICRISQVALIGLSRATLHVV